MAKVKVDFTGVESFVKCGEGQHIARVKSAKEEVASTGADMIVVQMEVVKGSSTGATVYNNFVLSEKALWRLKGFLVALGMKADGKVALDLDNLVGKTCIIEVAHREYNGSSRAEISDFVKIVAEPVVDEDDEEEEEDDEPAPPPAKAPKAAKAKAKPAKPPVDEDEDDDWEDV